MFVSQKKIQHLFLRAAFGESPAYIQSLSGKNTDVLVDNLIGSSEDYKNIAYLPYPLTEDREDKGVSGVQLVSMILKSKQDMEELNAQWIFKMVHTKAVFREKMVLFWHNHFATSAPFAYLMQEQNNMIRKHALGKFSDLLHAISKDPAMIIYLNNQQNKKNQPNENFAREVMELFTLGIGNYTENDIKEAGRAFTGWTVNTMGEFEFHPKEHDDGEKTFMGEQGNFNGDDIIRILLKNKQTAIYVSQKIYKEFVNPVLDSKHVQEIADIFYHSDYDIKKTMRHIFTSEWFYDDVNMGSKICSPVELIVRYSKLLKVEFQEEKTMINLQKALGQVLFFPPNVAGWKGGNSWIDSTTLLLRLSMPKYILNRSDVSLKVKPAFEIMNADKDKDAKNGKIKADWNQITTYVKDLSDEKTTELLLEFLLQNPIDKPTKNLVATGRHLEGNERIIMIASNIMSLPEFQMI